MKIGTSEELSKIISLENSEYYGDLHTIYCSLSGSEIPKDQNLSDFSVNMKEVKLNDKPLFSKPCFFILFSDIDESPNEYDRYVIGIGIKNKVNSPGTQNNTWMTKEQLEEHINYLRTDLNLDFDFRVEEDVNYKNSNSGIKYIVALDTKGNLNRLEKKFVCCWIRYSYEFPSNYLLLDVYRLKNLYPGISVFNLFLLASEVGRYYGYLVKMDQCISTSGEFLTNNELAERLKHENKLSKLYKTRESSLKGLYTVFLNCDSVLKERLNYFKTYKTFEFWAREDLFERRLKGYKALLFSKFLRIKYLKEKIRNKAKG